MHYNEKLALDIEAVQNFEDYGTNVGPIPPAIAAEVERQAVIFYDEMSAEDPFFAEVTDSILEFRKVYGEAWQRL